MCFVPLKLDLNGKPDIYRVQERNFVQVLVLFSLVYSTFIWVVIVDFILEIFRDSHLRVLVLNIVINRTFVKAFK